MAFRESIASSPFGSRVRFYFDDESHLSKLDSEQEIRVQPAGTHVYVCGPKGFIGYVTGSAERAGLPGAQTHLEYFSAAPVDSSGDQAFSVKIASSGQVIEIPADQTALRVLEAHGLSVEYSCEQGICGSCVIGVLEGIPEHRDMFLLDEERAGNRKFTPCCSRSKSPLLVVDL